LLVYYPWLTSRWPPARWPASSWVAACILWVAACWSATPWLTARWPPARWPANPWLAACVLWVAACWSTTRGLPLSGLLLGKKRAPVTEIPSPGLWAEDRVLSSWPRSSARQAKRDKYRWDPE